MNDDFSHERATATDNEGASMEGHEPIVLEEARREQTMKQLPGRDFIERRSSARIQVNTFRRMMLRVHGAVPRGDSSN